MKYYHQFNYPSEFQGTEFQAQRVIQAYNTLTDMINDDKKVREIEVNTLCDIKTKMIYQMLSYETTSRIH